MSAFDVVLFGWSVSRVFQDFRLNGIRIRCLCSIKLLQFAYNDRVFFHGRTDILRLVAQLLGAASAFRFDQPARQVSAEAFGTLVGSSGQF